MTSQTICPRRTVGPVVSGSRKASRWERGSRDTGTAYEFMSDVASRMRSRVQLTTDGHKPYLLAVEGAFGADIDYGTLTKIYGSDPDGESGTARRNVSA